MSHIEPFIRWAGGKRWLVPFIEELTRTLTYKNYYEPFLGGASIFFSLNPPKHIYLSDINAELIDTYAAIRDIPDDVIHALQLLQNTEKDYYIIRESEPKDLAHRAARFLYLNQTSREIQCSLWISKKTELRCRTYPKCKRKTTRSKIGMLGLRGAEIPY